jgi:DHA2 family multidrug resistance protein-like MFS transporter
MSESTSLSTGLAKFHGNDKLPCGILFGVVSFWLFTQTTLKIAPDMGKELGFDASMMNLAVAMTVLSPCAKSNCYPEG